MNWMDFNENLKVDSLDPLIHILQLRSANTLLIHHETQKQNNLGILFALLTIIISFNPKDLVGTVRVHIIMYLSKTYHLTQMRSSIHQCRLVNTWRQLARMWQQDNKDLVDYYKRFDGMVLMVE